jgi:hypothetical protein
MLSHFYPEQTNFDVGEGSQLNYLKLKEEEKYVKQERKKVHIFVMIITFS